MDFPAETNSNLKRKSFALSKAYGKSMRPLIWGGQHCLAVAPLEGEPEIGDILMFRQKQPDGSERNVVHRLVKIVQEGDRRLYFTRGDNNMGCEKVLRTEIIGRVAEVHRISGFRPWHIIPKKKFTVTDPAYLFYSRVWNAIFPLRRVYYYFRGKANGLRARLLALIK